MCWPSTWSRELSASWLGYSAAMYSCELQIIRSMAFLPNKNIYVHMSKIFTTISTRDRPGLSSLLFVGGCEHGLLLERGPGASEEGDHQLRLLVHHVGGQELPEVLLQLILPPVQKQSETIYIVGNAAQFLIVTNLTQTVIRNLVDILCSISILAQSVSRAAVLASSPCRDLTR